MASTVDETTAGVLNETTNTIHKQKPGDAARQTECGLTHQVPRDSLRHMSLERAIDNTTITKCGRCFPDAGGY